MYLQLLCCFFHAHYSECPILNLGCCFWNFCWYEYKCFYFYIIFGFFVWIHFKFYSHNSTCTGTDHLNARESLPYSYDVATTCCQPGVYRHSRTRVQACTARYSLCTEMFRAVSFLHTIRCRTVTYGRSMTWTVYVPCCVATGAKAKKIKIRSKVYIPYRFEKTKITLFYKGTFLKIYPYENIRDILRVYLVLHRFSILYGKIPITPFKYCTKKENTI